MKEVYARMIFQLWGRMTFGPSKRHEATRYVTRGGGWKKHGNRISSHPLATPTAAGRGVVPSFRRRNFVPGFVRLVVLTPSLIKSLYFFPPSLPPSTSLFLGHLELGSAEITALSTSYTLPSPHIYTLIDKGFCLKVKVSLSFQIWILKYLPILRYTLDSF